MKEFIKTEQQLNISALQLEVMNRHGPSGGFGGQQNSRFHLPQQILHVLKQQNRPRVYFLFYCWHDSFSEML